MSHILQTKRRCLLSGNEAVARGVLEAGVHVVAGYPGTPSTEVIDTLRKIAKKLGLHVEWCVNEKVAVEVAAGAAWAGKRALATMKMSGLNVASDSLLSIAYSGTDGGLVVYVTDDPAAHAGMCEQDSRYYAKLGVLPMFDVSSPQESKDFIVKAFDLSEKIRGPVMVRSTTNVAHSYFPVNVGEIRKIERVPSFKKDIYRYTKVYSVQQHIDAIKRLNKALKLVENGNMNRMHFSDSGVGVIGCGVAFSIFEELKTKLNLNVSWLKVDLINPVPEEKIKEFLKCNNKVLVLEELEPVLESEVRSIASLNRLNTYIIGKLNNIMPRIGEYSYSTVVKGLNKLLEEKLRVPETKKLGKGRMNPLVRSLTFCPGCPHRGTYYAINKALSELRFKKGEVVVTGDIGCTIIGIDKPFETVWTEVAMGASIGVAQGLRLGGIKEPVIATIGDSTFYHAGVPALINAVQHGINLTVVVLDNRWVAMTGHQPTPGTGVTALGDKAPEIRIEDIAKACKVDFVKVINPFNTEESVKTIKKALKHKGVSVVVSRGECALQWVKEHKIIPYYVDWVTCIGCKVCIREWGCPAIEWVKEKKKAYIAPSLCTGCSLCSQTCPVQAIKKRN